MDEDVIQAVKFSKEYLETANKNKNTTDFNHPSNDWTHESFASGVRYVGKAMINSSSSYSVNNCDVSSYISMSTNFNSG